MFSQSTDSTYHVLKKWNVFKIASSIEEKRDPNVFIDKIQINFACTLKYSFGNGRGTNQPNAAHGKSKYDLVL